MLQTALIIVALAAIMPGLCVAAESPSTITVAGQGTIRRDPDRATLSVSVITSNDSAATATSQNNQTYNAVIDHLRAIGLTESAVKTRSYDVTFVAKQPPNAGYKPPHTGYVVTRALAVTIDNLSLVGRAIDAAVAGGAGQIDGVAYGLKDTRSAYMAALVAAMQDAESQSSALAGAAHVHLGSIRRISTGGGTLPVPVTMRALAAAPMASVPTEITPSTVEVHATVTVTYAIGAS